MRQWFRGQLEGHYEGLPSVHPGPSKDMRGRPHQLRIYRAHVRGLELIEPPDPARADPEQKTLYQARVEHARLETQHTRGLCLEGPIFELSLDAPRLTHPARFEGRLFGRVEGTAVGCFEVPQEPQAQELVARAAPAVPSESPESTAAATPLTRSSEAPESEPSAQPEPGESSVRLVPLELPAPSQAEVSPAATNPDAPHVVPEVKPPPRPKAPPSNLPLLALVGALALTLLVTAGAGPALLWLSFLLPSLLVRRFLRGVLPDATAFRAIGALLIGAQVCWVGWTLLGWSTAPCKELHVLPLAALVGGVFLAGVLPYLLPMAINAFGFALVLGMWSVGPGQVCGADGNQEPTRQVTPSVKHPGEPRTNEDGSWPREPVRE
ncbi:MAG: hypothetical protein QM778_14900 [Myxococcales bacterium]